MLIPTVAVTICQLAQFEFAMQPVLMDQKIVRAWLMPNGAILCVDQGFMDYAGWAIKVGIVASVENFV